MRFTKIHLKDLPEKGLFCIQGENESGKSTLGALLYFAFSGVGPHGESAEQLICWEQTQLKVKVSFEFNQKKYELIRQVDRDGSNFSKLVCEGEALARGNTSILETFEQLFHYNPKELHRSFLVTHRVIQKLSNEPRGAHLEYMLNLDPLKKLAQKAALAEKHFITALEQQRQKQTLMTQERDHTGYNAEKQTQFLTTQKQQLLKKQELEKQLHSMQDQLNGRQNIQDHLNDAAKQLPSKFTAETADQLEQGIPQLVERFSQLHVSEKPKECLQQSESLLKELHDYLKKSKSLRKSFEVHLSDLRQRLGLNNDKEPNPNSLIGKTQLAHQTFQSSLKALRFWVLSCVFSIIIYTGTLVCIGIRPTIVKMIKPTPIYKLINGGALSELAQGIRILLKPSSIGVPLDPRLIATLGFSFLFIVVTILMVLYYRKKSNLLNASHELALKEQEKLQQNYSQLLSADFKDMAEVGSIIDKSNSEDLIQLFDTFKNEHQTIVAEEYRLEPIIRSAKDHLEEAQQNLSLEMHKINNDLEALENERNQLIEELAQSDLQVNDMLARQEQYETLVKNLTALELELQKNKTECAVQKCLAEMAIGTTTHIRQRFQRALAGLFKQLMPKLTQERYGAVRVSDHFELEVFSEERGDFVSLRLLSSGTNDLFNLIFQTLLLQAFMEARQLQHHFLFLDEPLLAVDVVRYQKLTELLPELSSGLSQIFLCRPPQNLAHSYLIETSLAQKELIVNFASLQPRNNPA